jgi:hypothetical protein
MKRYLYLSCLMHCLKQHFVFSLLLAVLAASFFEVAIADNSLFKFGLYHILRDKFLI